MSTGSRIAHLRRARGLTQAQLASAAGVSASTIAMYETGRRTPDPEHLDKLAAALGVPPDQLKPGPADAEEARPVHDGPASAGPVPAGTAYAGEQNAGAAGAGLGPDAAGDGPESADEQRQEKSAQDPAEPAHDSPSQEGPAGQPSPSYPAIPLDRFEARLILFLRLNPQARAFIEAYLAADERRRQQIHKTWRLIHELQP
ncbi:helix-turn-helix domain-containing protein [Alicyclobacillus macrosporangiidus]|uniref:Helix-turn-helix domain-containing protein n=1 Tax=Alicyclobacillus macrosporangiidus TaxID=392015 RepID=A0A1I7GE35_9BACL|nr:helix-turn-helix transcriptional regulator [Alicyclobacillus macrosporangiidus]SFU46729.1 Helix-turn-helix domain-containing protein [Alicyclobacillus macrosporangiidus]